MDMKRKRVARHVLSLVIAGCLIGGGYTAATLMRPADRPAPSQQTPVHETPSSDVSPRFVKA